MKQKILFFTIGFLIFVGFPLIAQSGSSQPRLAVLLFDVSDTSNRKLVNDAVTVSNLFLSNIVQSRHYSVMTRQDIDRLVAEQGLQASTITEAQNLSKLKMRNISYLVVGTVNAADRDYVITMSVLDVATGQFTYSDNTFITSTSNMIVEGVNRLSTRFVENFGQQGGSANTPSSVPMQITIGIAVTTGMAGTLYLDGNRRIELWDNDSYVIPIGRPGNYRVTMRFINGQEETKTVTISSRGITSIRFRMPPDTPTNVQAGTAGIDSIPLSWDNVGSGISYKVYYSRENTLTTTTAYITATNTSITVEDLNYNSTYYFWVSAVENNIESTKSAVISKMLVVTRIGTKGPAGGIIFYDKGDNVGGWRYLEAAPHDLEKAQWGSYGKNVIGMDDSGAVGTGKQNIQLLIGHLQQIGEKETAAQLCIQLNIGGYTDWFLPGLFELKTMLLNLERKGLGNFKKNEEYWSSTQRLDGYNAFAVSSTNIRDQIIGRNYILCVRAIRAF